MRRLCARLAVIVLNGLLFTSIVIAQTASCPVIVQSVLDTADEICQEVGRNQVCYVNLQAEIIPSDPAIRIKFNEPGDLLNLEYVAQMVMSPLNTLDETWGVSLMKLQANLPDTVPGQNVTMLLFGDVEIRNEVNSGATMPSLPATATTNANVRVAPSTNAGLLTSLDLNEAITLDGRNSDGTWVRLQLANDVSGWVFSDLLTVDGDIMMLESVIAGEQSDALNPMQAFYIKTGIGDSACDEAPESGVLIQTPSGGQKINLTVNGVDISLGSTAFLQAQDNQALTMAVVEGEGTLTADETTITVPAGSQSSVPLNDNGEPAGPPEEPTPYDSEKMDKLPIKGLAEDIEIAEPLSEDDLNDLTSIPSNIHTPPMDTSAFDSLMFLGLPQECMDIIDKLIAAANNYDVDAVTALEPDFNNICLPAVEALTAQYEGFSDNEDDSSGD